MLRAGPSAAPTSVSSWNASTRLVRQLKNARDSVRVEAFTSHSRGASSAELLRDIRENPAVLLTDPTKELRTSE